jgi:hypothetical protein
MFLKAEGVSISKRGQRYAAYLRKTDETIGAVTVVAIQDQKTVIAGVVQIFERCWSEVFLQPQRP